MTSRLVVLPLLAISALMLGACAGGTDPATNVTDVSAQLNAHGYSNDGPASWWWEYDTVQSELGTAGDTEVCGVGTGPKEADKRCGPASGGSQSNPIPLNVVVTGLTPNTTYYFRACGQDTNDPSPTCANTRSFTTLAGTSYVFDRKWGSFGGGNGQFSTPSGVATDSAANVYVADRDNNRIQKFTSTGAFITKWGSEGTGNGQFDLPFDLATDSTANVYVADWRNNRIQKFSSTGAFITKWGSVGSADGQFQRPTSIATDSTGNVYVGDPGNDRIQKFSSSGAFITKWSAEASGVATDSAANVYVAGSNSIQKFSSSGSLITSWGSPGSGNGQFNGPDGIGTDSAGNVYVADTFNQRIQKFSSTGAFITKWGSLGSGDGQFINPRAVATDSQGNVYVAEGGAEEGGNARIQKFKPSQ